MILESVCKRENGKKPTEERDGWWLKCFEFDLLQVELCGARDGQREEREEERGGINQNLALAEYNERDPAQAANLDPSQARLGLIYGRKDPSVETNPENEMRSV